MDIEVIRLPNWGGNVAYWEFQDGRIVQVDQPPSTSQAFFQEEFGAIRVLTFLCHHSPSYSDPMVIVRTTNAMRDGVLEESWLAPIGEAEQHHKLACSKVLQAYDRLVDIEANASTFIEPRPRHRVAVLGPWKAWLKQHAQSAWREDFGILGKRVVIPDADEAVHYKLRWV